ncbi:MAG TPA: hypothetical protein DCX07_09960 [Phycisphaerales bacterium]|nr:hypothetical protein [Phycisphaerales bacterium]
MSFLSPYFLVALAGAAAPILIHLLTRDRIRKVAFSTLRFFVRTSGRVLRRKRIQEMILMAMRAMACALLAVAFARPLLGRPEEKDKGLGLMQARTARVIVADLSASMRRDGAPDALRAAAREALDSLDEGVDAAAVVTFSTGAELAAPLGKTFAQARDAVKTLAPGRGGTNLVEALRLADAEVRKADATSREIVLVSDLQEAGWKDRDGEFRLSPGVKLLVKPVVPSGAQSAVAIIAGNAPVTSVIDREPQAVRVQVANYSAEPREDVEVTFRAGQKTETRKLALRPASVGSVTFRHVFDTPGDVWGSVQLGGASGDGAFHFNTRVIPRIKVLLIDGVRASERMSDAAFYLQTAMSPGEDVASPFECRVIGAAQASPGDLSDARVVILCNVSELPPPVVLALGDLLARGGGVWFLPGGRVDAQAFNRTFAELAPCKLRRVLAGRAMATGGVGAVLARIDFQHPIFEVFSHPRHGDLSLAKFARYWEVTDSQLSQVLVKFDDNRPAVLSRQVGQGISMLLAACPDKAWSDFPLQTTFLPYVWQTLEFLAARTEQRTSFTVGDVLPAGAGERIVDPQGKEVPLDQPARLPGFYAVRDADGKDVRRYAVNCDGRESDPTAVAPDEIVAALEQPADKDADQSARTADAKATPREDQGLWWYVLAACLTLLVGELLLGNKTTRH